MPQTKSTNVVARSGGWAQFLVKWVIAAVAAILMAVGAVGLVKTVYKSTLSQYPVDQFKLGKSAPPTRVDTDGKEIAVELTQEQKADQAKRDHDARILDEINDYALAAGQLLAGFGLWYVFRLIVKKGD